MELQADLVAVSLTGSDALIHALYKLNVADEAWERSLAFADSEARDKRGVSDLFAVQKHITEKLRHVLDDPSYGECCRRPRTSRTSIASSRPRSRSRRACGARIRPTRARAECQAPVHSRLPSTSAARGSCSTACPISKRMTAHVFRAVQEAADVPLEQSLAKLDEQFGRAYYDRSYRGAYLGRRWRYASRGSPALRSAAARRLHRLSCTRSIRRRCRRISRGLKALEEEKATLQRTEGRIPQASGGVLRYRGKDLKRAICTRSTKCRASSTRRAKR